MTQNTPTPPHQRSLPRRLLNRMEVDRAVFFAVLTRVWQLGAGLVTLFLLSIHFNKGLLDCYGVFANLLALQAFAELGLHIVIINLASHEWSNLALDSKGFITGDARALSRLVSIGRFIFKWYAVACGGLVLVGGTIGALFVTFARDVDPAINWVGPWALLISMTGLLMWTLPFNALLEGCNQVIAVNRFRVIQVAIASVVTWLCLVGGAELWTLAIAALSRVLCDLCFLLVAYRRFFKPFFFGPDGPHMNWRTEIWPLQWRIAIQGVFGFFSFHLFTLVMFKYQTEGTAGQMYLTWTALTALQAAALTWVQTRTPRFGMLIAQQNFSEADRVFRRVAIWSMTVLVTGGAGFCGFVTVLNVFGANVFNVEVAEKILPPLPTVLFTLGLIAFHIANCLAIYVRAHKREPFLVQSIVSSVTIGVLVWYFGREYGPVGAGGAFFGVNALITVPSALYLTQRCRAERARIDA